jgi:flagellar basal body-associated protein FliL
MAPNRGVAIVATLFVVLFSLGAIALILRDSWTRSRGGAPPPKESGGSLRRTRTLATMILVAAFILALFVVRSQPVGRPRPAVGGPVTPVPLWVTIVPSLFIVALVYAILRRARRKETSAVASGGRAWIWILVVIGVALAAYSTQRGGQGQAPQNLDPGLEFVVLFFFLVLLLCGALILVVWLKNRDAVTARAIKRAQDGDVDGALRDLLEVSEIKGVTAKRANALGCLYLEKKEYQEALERFAEAERLGYNSFVCRANRAVALRKSGRTEEAIALYDELSHEKPDEPAIAAMYCLALADTGQIEAAFEQYRRAQIPPPVAVPGEAHRVAFEAILRECRERLGEMPPKPEGLHEL